MSNVSKPLDSSPICYPFSAIVGMENAKRALMLLAVDPLLKGVLVASTSGAAKSTLARSFRTLLEDSAEIDTPFVEVPLNVTEDMLLGSIDFEGTLKIRRLAAHVGLLARADRGILFVDGVNRLDDALAAEIAGGLESGVVPLQHGRVDALQPTRFGLVGTYNPDEGEVSTLLRDRVGLLVGESPSTIADSRATIVERVGRFEQDRQEFGAEYKQQDAELAQDIKRARHRLSMVDVSTENIVALSRAALALGVEGNRGDWFAVRTARANAALCGRESIAEADLVVALQLVLEPRAREVQFTRQSLDASESPDRGRGNDPSVENAEERGALPEDIENLIIEAANASLPAELMTTPKRKTGSGKAGKSGLIESATKGRYVRSTKLRLLGSKVAIDATLRAAAPLQIVRKRSESVATKLKVTKDDLRFKVLKRRTGVLFILVVDASGSMAANRMAQAKGALISLLRHAYLHRDKVSLISFRGSDAQLLLSPTRSVERGRRVVAEMPAGGGTPLAAGLIRALEVARLARIQDGTTPMLVIFTDGRANVGLDPNAPMSADGIRGELEAIGLVLRRESIDSVVIDTRAGFASSDQGQTLAGLLGGRHISLPRPVDDELYQLVSSTADQLRSLR